MGQIGLAVLLAVASLQAGLTVLVLVGVYLLLGETLDILAFVIFLVIGSRVFDPLTMARTNLPELRCHALSGERILALWREPVTQEQQRPPEKHDIEFASVTFGYGHDTVLHDVSLKMPEGSMIALVGPSGCGKSTILKLVARFYDPQSGKILFGKEDTKKMDPEEQLERISMVFQDVYLFKDTIANNIRFDRVGTTLAEVKDAARKACCHEFIIAESPLISTRYSGAESVTFRISFADSATLIPVHSTRAASINAASAAVNYPTPKGVRLATTQKVVSRSAG